MTDELNEMVQYRSFSKISSYLKNQSCLSDREIGIYFLQGLEPSFRIKLQGQLRAEDPKHHTDDPCTLAEISAAALFVLLSNHAEFSCQEVPSILIKKESLNLSSNLIIDAIVAAITKQPNMELQQLMERRMDKQKGIHAIAQSKKEPEVSSLKKSDSITIIPEPHSRYITPIQVDKPIKLVYQSPNQIITIPTQFQDSQTMAEQQTILAIKITNSSQDTKPKPSNRENVLVLANNIQDTSQDYDTSQVMPNEAPQEVEQAAAKAPSKAMLPLVTPSQPLSPPISKFLHIPEMPCNLKILPDPSKNDSENKSST